MNEQNKKQIIVAAVLGVILVGVLVKQFVFAPGPSATATPAGGAKTAQAGRAAQAKNAAPGALQQVDIDIEALIKSVEVEPINYATVRIARNPMDPLVGGALQNLDAGQAGQGGVTMVNGEPGQDPTANPDAAQTPAAPTPLTDAYSKRVTGIVWDVSYPVAVVDDEVVSVGHVFPNGTQVYSIEPSRVILKVGDATIPIEMKDM